MITTGTMRLPQPESLDDLRAFLRGLEPDGGYWEAMRRLSDHDHSGGLMGAPVAGGGGEAAYLPLVGGTLSGDLVVSEATPTVSLKLAADTQPRARLTDTALGFGPGGVTAPDVTLTRTGAGALELANTSTRLAVSATGTLTLAPDTGLLHLNAAAGDLKLGAPAAVLVTPGNAIFAPTSDNAVNCGWSSLRWGVVYAVAGVINTSSRRYKDPEGDLDPEAALAAVRRTPARRFKYKGSERLQAGYYLEEADPLFAIGPPGSDEVSASNDTGVLLAALQALCATVQQLQERVQALEPPP